MTDVFRNLPVAKWRDIEFPISDRKASFDQDTVRHKLQYSDQELVESLGRKNWVFEYSIPFREDIKKGPKSYNNLFFDKFYRFIDACKDRSVAELIDPVLGTFNAKCLSFHDASNPHQRDGDEVSVVFVQAPQQNDPINDLALGITTSEKRIDDVVARIYDSQLAAVGLLRSDVTIKPDIFDQIAGFGQQIAAAGNRVTATLAKYQHKLNNIERALNAVGVQTNDPTKMADIRVLRRIQDQTERLAKTAPFTGQQLGSYIVVGDTPIGQLAQQLKTPLSAFMLLNPTIPRPLVTAGTSVQYFASGASRV